MQSTLNHTILPPLLLAALLMWGCTAAEQADVRDTADEAAITFNPVVNSATATSRVAVVTGNVFPVSEAFRVYAYASDATTVCYGDKVNYITEFGTWWTSPHRYWPQAETVDFYAVTPYGDSYTAVGSYAGGVAMPVAVSPNSAERHDVMYAVAKGLTRDDNYRDGVPLHFCHAMCKVEFSGYIADDDITSVTVYGLQLCNVGDKGTFTFPATTTTVTSAVGSWTPTGAAESCQDYTAVMAAESITLTDDTPTRLTDETAPLVLMPGQTLAAWNPADDPQRTAKGCYLAISCVITADAELIVGTMGAGATVQPATIYAPFGIDEPWQPGMSYNYRLGFGMGYDSDGNGWHRPIEVTLSIKPWGNTVEDPKTLYF